MSKLVTILLVACPLTKGPDAISFREFEFSSSLELFGWVMNCLSSDILRYPRHKYRIKALGSFSKQDTTDRIEELCVEIWDREQHRSEEIC